MSKYEVGQMAVVIFTDKEGNITWNYLVVVKVYDEMTHFVYNDGSKFAEFISDTEGKSYNYNDKEVELKPLYQNGRPVFSKRSFFGLGRYNFEPTTKDGEV